MIINWGVSGSGYRRPVTPMIHVSAVVLNDTAGRVLMVRKRGTGMWMNPGGKPEPGESGSDCAAREVAEELRLELERDRLVFLGQFSAPAANEPGHTVVSLCFLWPDAVPVSLRPAAEIEAVRWVTPDELGDRTLAPLFVESIAPRLGGHWVG